MKSTVLVAAADIQLRRTLKALAGGEFRWLFTKSAKRARAILRTKEVHLAVIQRGLPDTDGLSLARHMQEHHSQIPVVLLVETIPTDLLGKPLALEYGVQCVFERPVTGEAVLNALRLCRDKGGMRQPAGIFKHAQPGRSGDPERETKQLKREVRMEEMRTLFEEQPCFWTCGKLAVRYGVSRQQIARDVAKLRRRGIPIRASQKGYFLDTQEKSVTCR